MMKMRREYVAVISLCLVASVRAASAADMAPAAGPTYSKAAPADPARNWSGFYVGGNAGYMWGRQGTSLNILDFSDGTDFNCWYCGDGAESPFGAAGSPSLRLDSFVGGGQAGINRQFGNWVVGIEADFDFVSRRNRAAATVAAVPDPDPDHLGSFLHGNFSTQVGIDWVSTVRPRIGYAFGNILTYATGGAAFARMHYAQSYVDDIGSGATESVSMTSTRLGWALGAGVEYALSSNWSVRAEYLHSEFGSIQAVGALRTNDPGLANRTASFTHQLQDLSLDTVRAGINYRFGSPY